MSLAKVIASALVRQANTTSSLIIYRPPHFSWFDIAVVIFFLYRPCKSNALSLR